MMEFYRKPEIESNWWRIIVYLLLCIVAILIFSIPVVTFFWDLIQDPDRDILDENLSYQLAIQTVMALGIITTSYLMIKQIEYRSAISYRLTFNLKSICLGFSIGLIAMILFGLIAYVFGLVDFIYQGLSLKLAISFVLYLFVGVAEEVLVRGYILTNLQEKLNPFWALLISSLFFGALHIGNDYFTWIGFATISISSFLMGLLVLRTKSISSAIGLHWSWNFVQGPILGFAVSGHQEVGLFSNTGLGSEILTGGKFGAEGSIVLCAITVTIIFFTYRFYSEQKVFVEVNSASE
jgi:uncharacterized protein